MAAILKGEIPSSRFPDAGARVISSAIVPLRRASPQTALSLAFAATLGALTACGFVLFRLGADQTLRSRAQVIAATGVKCLACLPYDPAAGTFAASRRPPPSDHDYNAFLRSMSAVRTSVLSGFPKSHGIAIGVTSVLPGEGKSRIALGLAQVIAASQGNVVLLDGNLLNPTLTRDLSLKGEFGLSDALQGALMTNSRLMTHAPDDLQFVPAYGEGRPRQQNVFIGGPATRELLEELRRDNVVIVDSTATSLSSDALAFASFLDGVILVVEAGKASNSEIKDAIAAFSVKTHIFGVILNKLPR
jgi:succinoglycan biosynthesis transport protein ExoP